MLKSAMRIMAAKTLGDTTRASRRMVRTISISGLKGVMPLVVVQIVVGFALGPDKQPDQRNLRFTSAGLGKMAQRGRPLVEVRFRRFRKRETDR